MSHDFDIRIGCQISLLVVVGFACPDVGICQSAPATAILATSDGKLVVGSDLGIHLHDAATLQREKRIESKIEKIYALKVSPDGKRLAVSGGTPAEEGVVEIYSLPDLENTHRFEQFDDIATDVAWMSDAKLVAGSMTGNCCFFRLDQPQTEPFNVHSKGVLAVEILTDGQIVSGGLDSIIRVWKPVHHTRARVLNNHVNTVNDIDTRRPTNRTAPEMIVSASDDSTIRFWLPTIGRMVRFVKLDAVPTCVIWNHDRSLAMAGCRDGAIRLVDPATAKVVRTIPGSSWIHCLATGGDDKLFVGSENGISIVQLNSSGY